MAMKTELIPLSRYWHFGNDRILQIERPRIPKHLTYHHN